MTQTLNLLPAGEYELIKRTAKGIYVLIGKDKVYIPYSETLNDSIFSEEDSKDVVE